ncbi:MAG: hypothetical protein E7268_03185 [Lachnospiraceae bacterium]|nr:hypothetical protein [Lachnospiraceae bacterium]
MSDELFYHKGERGGMHFHGRKRSKGGVAGFALAITAVAIFLTLCVVSAVAKGAAGIFVGGLGLLTMVICGAAFWLCFKGLKEQDVYTRLPFAGLLISGGLFVALFCLYIVGI